MDSYYDGIAPGYNALYGEEQQIKLQAISRLLHNTSISHLTLLDVGCGTGISSDYFVDKFNCKVIGVDPSRELIKQNQANKSTLLVGFAEDLPFSDNHFDVVVSVSAIQNFTDVQRGLDEIKRVGNNVFVLTFMSKENTNADKITEMIESTFTVKEKVTAKNDTVYLAVK